MIVNQTVRLRLTLTSDQGEVLSRTLREYAEAFNTVSRVGWQAKQVNAVKLHRKTYHSLRAQLDLPSQLVISARMKAIEALNSARALKKGGQAVSQPKTENPSIRFDARSYKLNWETLHVSLTVIGGRLKVPVRLDRQSTLFRGLRTSSAELCRRHKGWFLHITVDRKVEDPPPPRNVIGVDRGIRRPAVTSNARYFGKPGWKAIEERMLSLRRRLQAKGTRSARRHLRRLGKRLGRFRRDCDHVLSKALVNSCEPGDTLVFEDLTYLLRSVKARGRTNRRRLHAWSFARLEALVEYKAALRGVRIARIDPRDTSRRCPRCGEIKVANRPLRNRFSCVRCGFERNPDLVAAWNIRDRYEGLWAPAPKEPGLVIGPNASIAT